MANPSNNLFGTPASTGGGFNFGTTPAGSGGFSFGTPKPPATAAGTTSSLGMGGYSFAGGLTTGAVGSTTSLPFGGTTTSTPTAAASAGIAPGVGGFPFSTQPSTQPMAPAATGAPTGGYSLGMGVTPVGPNFAFGSTPAVAVAPTGAPTAAPITAAPAAALTLGGTAAPTMGAGGLSFGGAPFGTAPFGTTAVPSGFMLGSTSSTASVAPTIGGAPAMTGGTGGFNLGGGTTLGGVGSSGLNFGVSATTSAPGSGLGLGSLGGAKPLSFGAPTTTTTAAAPNAGQGISFGAKPSAPPYSTTVGGSGIIGVGGVKPLGLSTTTSAAGGGLPFGSTTPKASNGLGSLLGKPATTAITGTPSAGLSLSIPSGTSKVATATTTTSLSLGGLGTANTASKAPYITTTTTTTTHTSQGPSLSYHQLEQVINKWTVQLEDQEKIFLTQATQVNAWDRILIQNGEMITTLHSDLEKIKTDQQRLEHELDFIMAQLHELNDMLTPLEETVRTQQQGSLYTHHADSERERTYILAENIDGQLKRMVQDLREIIEHLNTANAPQDNNDPMTQVGKILNAHMDSLQWIDQNTVMLQRKVDEVTKQSEMVRRDQEKNVHLAFD